MAKKPDIILKGVECMSKDDNHKVKAGGSEEIKYHAYFKAENGVAFNLLNLSREQWVKFIVGADYTISFASPQTKL